MNKDICKTGIYLMHPLNNNGEVDKEHIIISPTNEDIPDMVVPIKDITMFMEDVFRKLGEEGRHKIFSSLFNC